MKKTIRYCVGCEEIFGCVWGNTIKIHCMRCPEVMSCALRFEQPDLRNVTGGICPTCYFIYKAEKAQKKPLYPPKLGQI